MNKLLIVIMGAVKDNMDNSLWEGTGCDRK